MRLNLSCALLSEDIPHADEVVAVHRDQQILRRNLADSNRAYILRLQSVYIMNIREPVLIMPS